MIKLNWNNQPTNPSERFSNQLTMSYANNSASQIRSADMFLTRALEKMLADKELKRSANAQLKKQTETLLGKLKYNKLDYFVQPWN